MDSSTDTTLYIKTFNVYSGESSKTTRHLFSHKYDTYNSINFRAIISGSKNLPIITPPTTPTENYIEFKTINGNSLLGPGNLQFLTADDVATYSKLGLQSADTSDKYYLLGLRQPKNGILSDVSLNHHQSLYYTSSGSMYAMQYFASSDKRLKTNISEVSEDTITLPTIKEFDFIDTSVHSYGYIAQELEACGHEELVSTDSSGYKKVDYNAAHSLHIAKLEKENADLKNRIEKLEKLVTSLLEK